ncbi:hypothetical protein EDB86DRAFT_3089460 [Lactarius hatsudake]|nr:hypothetical protein EDB86DRAFT_3089460 [Lactarius hatsudake]
MTAPRLLQASDLPTGAIGRDGGQRRDFMTTPRLLVPWTPSPSSSNRRGRVASWTTWQPHENAPTPTQPPSPPPPNRRGSAGSWASWKSWKSHDNVPTPPSLSPSPSSPHMHDNAGSLVAQRLDESAATPPAQPPSPSSSSSPSNSSAESGFVLAARLEPFAPPMQASTSLQTAITAESEPAQDTSTVSLPVVVVQRRDGSGSWSHLDSSRASSSKSLVPAEPLTPRSSPPATPPPERSRSPSPSRRPSWSPTPLPTIAGQGLGLYIPRQSHSGSLSLSTPGTRFHTPVDESAEPGIGTQAYPSNPAPPASPPASIHASTSASASATGPIPPEPLDGWPGAPCESPIRGGSTFNGESVSRSADELQRDSGTASVQNDKSPPSPHVSPNSDTDIVASSQRPLHVIQNFDSDTSADAHSSKRGPDTDTPSPSSTGSA